MANQWLRLWHDMPNDPKWRTISRISGQPMALVQAVYIHLLSSASQNVTRGHADVTNEDLASHFDVTERDIDAVINAMQGRVLEGKYLTGWERRQPKREDTGNEETGAKSAAQRKREQRERQRSVPEKPDGKSTCHDGSRNVTTDKEEIKIREDLKDKTPYIRAHKNSIPDPKAANAIIDNRVPPSAGSLVDGKFTMLEGWQPSPDFVRKAALWGVNLQKPPAPEEIAEFVTYWNAEGKAFHQAQWEQKLARSAAMYRNRKTGEQSHAESRPNTRDPNFRGYAAEAVHAANAELRRKYGIEDEESDALLVADGRDVFGQVGSEKRGDTVITLDKRDWEAE